jgi:hypothetical protein
MKLGFILECGPQGADLKVCKNLVDRIMPKSQATFKTLDVKPKLVSGCGAVAKQLIDDGCERVYIIWDLYPAWRVKGMKPCRKEDRDNIFDSLNKAQVPLERVHLICIEQELESWLIADGRALSEFLSRPTILVKIKDSKEPDKVQNPKKYLTKHFCQNGKGIYTDYLHAEKLVGLIPDFQKLKKSETFKRFYFKLTGTQLT